MFPHSGSIKVAKLVLQEAGSYNPQYLRPYQTQFSGHVIDDINQRLNSVPGKMTATDLSGLSSQIMSPSAVHQGEIYVANGWKDNRIRFVMEVHVERSLGSTVIYYIQGFTNHVGVTTQGNIDPNMEFYINSFVQITRAYQNTPTGVMSHDVVSASAQVINGRLVVRENMNYQEFYTTRPMDIYNGLQTAHQLAAAESYYPNSIVTNRTVNHASEVVKNSRKSNVASRYVADLLNSHIHGMNLMVYGQDSSERMSQARSQVLETPIQENTFIKAISNVRGVISSTMFTFSDLNQLDPNVPNVTDYLIVGTTERASLNYGESSEYWSGADRTTQVATSLSHAIPAIMMECMIGKISFMATNHTTDGRALVTLTHASGLANVDMSYHYEAFKRRIEFEVMNDISFGNQELYQLEMTSDLFGNTQIGLQLGVEPYTRYNTPSFCDSLFAPVITTTKDAFFNTCYDFEMLLNNIDVPNGGMPVTPQEIVSVF